MNRRQSRAMLRADLAIARACALSRRPPSEWPPGYALARYRMLALQAAAGLADRQWRVEMNALRPVVLGPIPARAGPAVRGRRAV